MELTLYLKGQRPLLMHNGRLANPLDPYTRQMASINKKRGKTDEDLVQLMMVEARGGCWETEDGWLGIPNAAVWRSIYDASKAFKQGENIKRALLFDDVTVPLTINGAEVLSEKFVGDAGNIDYRSVKIQRNRVMRSRPKVVGWESQHTFTLNENVIDLRNMTPILQRAGELVGLGDWRPTYGTYTVEVL